MATPLDHFEMGHYLGKSSYMPPLQYEYKMVPKPQEISWSFDPKDDMTPFDNFEVVRVPVGVPYIDKGNHPYHQPGPVRVGCTMELVSVLAGEHWTDRPSAASPLLGQAMIDVNDVLPERARQKMLELVPRLVGTNVPMNYDLDTLIRDFWYQLGRIQLDRPSDRDVQELLGQSHRVLDIFDRQIGRQPRKLDSRTLTQLMTALAA